MTENDEEQSQTQESTSEPPPEPIPPSNENIKEYTVDKEANSTILIEKSD